MAAVLGEQKRTLVTPAGLRILAAIEAECGAVKDTLSTFMRRRLVIKVVQASSTAVRPCNSTPCACSAAHATRTTHFETRRGRWHHWIDPDRACNTVTLDHKGQ